MQPAYYCLSYLFFGWLGPRWAGLACSLYSTPPTPIVLPHAREDGPPPPPGGRLPSDPPLPPENRTTTINTHFQAQKLHFKTKEYSGRTVLPSCS